MKKFRLGSPYPGAKSLIKCLLMIKFAVLLIFSFSLQSFGRGYPQGTITLKLNNVPIRQVFKAIEAQASYRFVFKESILQKNQTVTIEVENASLEETLDQVLDNTSLTYRQLNKKLVVISIEDAEKENLPSDLPVSGKVTNSNGEPLSGASITVKNTNRGTTTDAAGNFSLTVPENNAVLVISFVGYSAQEIIVGNTTSFNISLDNNNMPKGDEVIVVGYGTQRRKAVTGSVSKVDLKNLQNTPATNISQALRGSVAGVQFTSSARPGQGGTILIRGQRSITASNDPLVVLDGIIFSGSINDINANDVESMEVLQDASAGAIYGTRAANGVILITTKRGTTEKPTINFNTYYGTQDYSHKIKLNDPKQYIQAILDYRSQSGQASDPTKVVDYLQPLEKENFTKGTTIDAYDVITQHAPIQSYEMGISGRTNRVSYFFSGGLTKDRGLILNDKQDRVSLRANIETKVTNWFRAGITSQFTQRDLSGTNAEVGLSLTPYGNLYFDEAKTQLRRYPLGISSTSNPIFEASRQISDDKNYNLFANIYGIIDIPFVKGLSYRLNYSPNLRWGHEYLFKPMYINAVENVRDSGTGTKFSTQNFDYYIENIVNYKKILARVHSMDLTLLYGRNHTEFDRTNVTAERFFNDALGFNNLSLARIQTIFTDAVETNGISSMARLNYGFKDKYFITLTTRRDGASVFGPNNKFGIFPSAAFAWIVSDENFIPKNNLLGYLKLRVSYGKVGNQAIDAYSTVPRLSNNYPNNNQVAYVFGDGGRPSIGLYPSNIVNNDLKWETTSTLDAAVDFELFKGRIGGTVGFYNSNTNDLLLDQGISPITGFSSLRTNIGSTNNKGLTVSLNTVNIRTGKFRWTTNLAFSTNKNKIVSLGGRDLDNNGREDDNILNGWFIGKPINSFYDFVFDGIYQDHDALPAGYKAGYVRLADLNKDGKVDASGDRTIVGQQQPKQTWGLTNNVSYGDFSLSAQLTAMTGWIAPYIGLDPKANYAINITSVNLASNGYWTPANQSTTRPSLVYPNAFQHSFYASRDFLRLQNVSLAYDFKNLLGRLNLNVAGARLYVSGRNLFTITEWPGFDPEGSVSLNLERTRQSYQGFDNFPMPRIIVVGLNLGF